MFDKREQAQQKLADTSERVIKAAGGVSAAMAVLAALAVAALAIATVAIALVVRRGPA